MQGRQLERRSFTCISHSTATDLILGDKGRLENEGKNHIVEQCNRISFGTISAVTFIMKGSGSLKNRLVF